jgi:hypothetical protein
MVAWIDCLQTKLGKLIYGIFATSLCGCGLQSILLFISSYMTVEGYRRMEKRVINTRLLTYDIKVSKMVSNSIRTMGYTDITTLGVVITNLIACLKKSNLLVYSRMTSGKKKSSRKGINATKVMRCIDFLSNEGFVINHIGKAHKIVEKREVSYIIPTDKFIVQWNLEDLVEEAMKSYEETIQVIELRDQNKNSIPYRNTQDVKKMEDVVRNLNRMNESFQIHNGDGKVMTNFYCRIFNESFAFGGRFYKADVLAIKNKKTDARLDIKIEGHPVCEIDFCNLHFRIAAALEDMDVDYLPLDVYSGILEDESNKTDRAIVKIAVNIMFNCFNEESAEDAIRREINLLKAEEKPEYTLGNAKSVMLLIYDAYPQFTSLFCSKDSYGRVLQNADSHLANDILEVMIENNIACLPVHDSFVVQIKHADLLSKTMGDCFRKRFGVDYPVPISLSWREDGKTIEEKLSV